MGAQTHSTQGTPALPIPVRSARPAQPVQSPHVAAPHARPALHLWHDGLSQHDHSAAALVEQVWRQDWAREVSSPRGDSLARRRLWLCERRRPSELERISEEANDGADKPDDKR